MEWARFVKYLYRYWRLQAVAIILGLIILPLSLINPYLTKLIIDKAYAGRDLNLFLLLIFASGGILVFNDLVNSLTTYLSRRINRRVNFDMTKDVFNKIQNLPLAYFDEKSTDVHLYNITSDVFSVSGFICNVIPQIITLFPRLLFILVIVFYLNWKLAILALIMLPITYIHPYFSAKWLREITQAVIEKSQGIFKRMHEAFTHIHLVKAFGKEGYEIKRFEESLLKKVAIDAANERVSTISGLLGSVLNKFISGVIVLYGGYQVIEGGMTLGGLTAVTIYLTQFTGLLNSIGRLYEQTVINSVACSRLLEVLDKKPFARGGTMPYRAEKGDIEFKRVSFAYKVNRPVLDSINFSIGGASKIALVGSSGCGKTTVVSLILGLYELAEGTILLDGIDSRILEINSLKRQIGVAFQNPYLWNDTIANNILYGGESAFYEDAVRCAKLAGAHDFIMKLPHQYDSVVGEMACKLSEGQKERIAIARALIKRPKILIFDEAISSLDSETEDRIIDNIKREFAGSTLIVVSHRLSTARKMDLVYFLMGPGQVEIGPHEALLERNQRYGELFASQVEEGLGTERV